jgi:hypothetical protein
VNKIRLIIKQAGPALPLPARTVWETQYPIFANELVNDKKRKSSERQWPKWQEKRVEPGYNREHDLSFYGAQFADMPETRMHHDECIDLDLELDIESQAGRSLAAYLLFYW